MGKDETISRGARDQGFVIWLGALQPDLRRRALRLTNNFADAADLAQATCLRALEKRALFVRGSATELRQWLFRVMANLHCDGLRRGSRETPVAWLDEVSATEGPTVGSWRTLGDDEVATAVDRLRPPLREVYRMFAIDRVSYAAISTRLRIPISTVATRILRARGHLRATLTGEVPPRTHGKAGKPRRIAARISA